MGARWTFLAFGAVAFTPHPCVDSGPPDADQLVAALRESLPTTGTVWLRMTSARGVRTLEWQFDRTTGRSQARVLAPEALAGSVLTVVDRPGVTDRARLYLPALRRETLLAGSRLRNGFLRSDLWHGDIEALALDGDLLGVVPALGGWGIESRPPAGGPYTKIRTTVRPADLAPVRAELYDGVRRIKVVEVLRTEVHDGWVVPMEVRITSWEGTRTQLEVLGLQLHD